MLTADMKRVIGEQRLGFVATVNPDGTPNVSPKATFDVCCCPLKLTLAQRRAHLLNRCRAPLVCRSLAILRPASLPARNGTEI